MVTDAHRRRDLQTIQRREISPDFGLQIVSCRDLKYESANFPLKDPEPAGKLRFTGTLFSSYPTTDFTTHKPTTKNTIALGASLERRGAHGSDS